MNSSRSNNTNRTRWFGFALVLLAAGVTAAAVMGIGPLAPDPADAARDLVVTRVFPDGMGDGDTILLTLPEVGMDPASWDVWVSGPSGRFLVEYDGRARRGDGEVFRYPIPQRLGAGETAVVIAPRLLLVAVDGDAASDLPGFVYEYLPMMEVGDLELLPEEDAIYDFGWP